jgi:antibiotic biosynthesis monooxygenase (ABM) superfamily enzyme
VTSHTQREFIIEQHIEVVRFRVAPESAVRFVAERPQADAALQKLAGFLGTELAQGTSGNWALIVRWATSHDVQAAQSQTLASPGLEPVNAWIALASEVLSFETLQLQYVHAPG